MKRCLTSFQFPSVQESFAERLLTIQMVKAFCTLCIPLLLGACYPVQLTYFEPSAESGNVAKVACKGTVGYPAFMNFEREGVHLTISAFREIEHLDIYLTIPKGTSVSFKPSDFVVSNESGRHYTPPESIDAFKFFGANSREPYNKHKLPVTELQTLQGEAYDSYQIHFQMKEASTFSFHVPPFRINNKEVMIPPIKFSLTSGWYVYPIYC